MARKNRRRGTPSNRRLPTRTRQINHMDRLMAVLGQNPHIEDVDVLNRVVTRELRKAPTIRHLAKKMGKSTFPKTYGVKSLPVAALPMPGKKPLQNICVQRQQRKEVINALGHAGKTGQKSPVWTKKSKIRC